MLSRQAKGSILALIAALALANSFIFSKSALNNVHFVQFGLIWFTFGLVWMLIYIAVSGDLKEIRKLSGAGHLYTFLVGLFEALGTAFFYIALKKVENPAIVSFLGNAGPVFVTLFGIILLREVYTRLEILGVVLAISGIFAISFQADAVAGGILLPGTEWIILASLMFATGTIIGRKQIKQLSPSLLSLIRVVLLLIVFIVLFFSLGLDLRIPASAYRDMAIGSFLEALVTMVAAYTALKYIQAVRMSILVNSKSIWVLISAFIFFHLIPETHQLIGGLLSLAGVVLLTIGKKKKKEGSA